MALLPQVRCAALAPVLVFAVFLAGPVSPVSAAEAAPEPSCAEGPSRSGDEIVGTPCADRIVVPASVEHVDAGAGDDTIIAAAVTAAVPCEGVCLGVRSPVFEGGPGDDLVFGERGNDTIRGNGGNDRLFGGIGDDLLEGGDGEDLLAGGFGADSINGQEGSDHVRGDGTIDRIYDTGTFGNDTLSYASGVTPGFGGGIDTGAANFPAGENGERGVYLNLATSGLNGNNGIAGEGGGVDEVEVGAFETIVGTPFSDWIVGTSRGETIYGGGGADLIEGGGGADQLFGGADGDDLAGAAGTSADGGPGSDRCQSISGATSCEANATKAVVPRGTGEVSVGVMAPSAARSQLYLTGSTNGETISASYSSGAVTVSLTGASFDAESATPGAGCTINSSTSATCPAAAPDSIVLAGLGGADTLTATGFPQQTGVVLLGGPGVDTLTGGDGSEDLLVDGRGAEKDTLSALGRDDALLHEGGPDELLGGEGNDLFLSTSICDGEKLNGGEGRDNASWARLGEGVEARLDFGLVGRTGAGDPGCGVEAVDTMTSVEDLEGSEFADKLIGDAGENQLLGHRGPDEYLAGPGADTILANSADSDPLINCGADADQAVIDIPTATYADATPIECESVRQGTPEDFRTVTELPPPPLVVTPPPDRKPPRTKITKRPAKLLTTPRRHRRVVFRFSSSEPGSSFLCKLDGKPYRRCTSPRVYDVSLGRHAVRIVAIDAAGNADRTPALLRFQIRQVPRR
jgi:Ca2+-binding RTX toxin-like protein